MLLILGGGPTIATIRKWKKETAEYLFEKVVSKTASLQKKLSDEMSVCFSPAFLITFVGPWR
jgi:hypothetical protein